MNGLGLIRIRGRQIAGPILCSLGCRVLRSSLVTLCTIISEMLCETSCLLFLQNSSDPVAVSAAALLGSTSLEELQQQTQMPGLGDKQPATI